MQLNQSAFSHCKSRRHPWTGGVATSVLLLGCLAAPLAQAQLRAIVNPSFEDGPGNPPPVPGAFGLFDANSVPGWNTTATDNLIELWGTTFNGVPSDEGSVHAELNANQVATLYQDLCLISGESIDWRFSHRGRSGPESMRLAIGGVTVVDVTTDTTGSGTVDAGTGVVSTTPQGWAAYSGTFTYTGASGIARFDFESLTGTSAGNLLDNIQVILSPTVEFAAATNGDLEDSGGDIPLLLVNGTVGAGVSVDVTVTGGDATEGTDFTNTVTVLIPPGIYYGSLASAIPINLVVTPDAQFEADETIDFSLGNPQGGVQIADTNCDAVTQTTNTYTIINDDPPGLSIDDVTVAEEDGSVTLTISLEAPLRVDVSVDWATADGSALDPVDYLAAAGTATILAGETSTTITITIVDDNGPEPTENFLVNLSNPVNAPIVDDQAIVTINDSDVIGIPTLGQGAMALLGLLLAGLGFGSLRRRNIVS